MASADAISVRDLSKSFKDLKVLNKISFSVKRGTLVALLGPNGAGKTTTIKILSTLLLPDKGVASVNGHDVVGDSYGVKSSIGLTGQYAAVDELLSGYENLVMMGELYHLSSEKAKSRALELLKQFDLEDASKRRAKTYSGGMRRRLDLAISLIVSPPILFLDEPTTGLDPRSRLTMWKIIRELVEGGTSILLTTQQLEEADQLADRIIVIDGGKVIAEGTSDKLKKLVGDERLELIIKFNNDFDRAKKVLDDGESMQSDEKKKSISLATKEGVGRLKKILDVLEKNKIEVESLSLHKPTLDDVFLKLTGHQASREQETDDDTTQNSVKGKLK